MSIVQNYRNAKLLLNAARKSRAPLGKLGNANIAAAGQGDRTPPRAPSRLRERCSVAIRSLSFALKAVVVPQPRLFLWSTTLLTVIRWRKIRSAWS